MEQLQMQEAVMEVSEEESVGEPEKDDEWENDEGNQMEYEQEFTEEVDREPFDATAIEKPSEALDDAIRAHEIEKQELQEILNIQCKNLVELQNVCEKISFTVDQIPTLRELKSQRCNEVLSAIQDLNNKYSLLNELIDHTVQRYDENLQLVYTLKKEFDGHKHLNYERCTVFEADLLDLAATGNCVVSDIISRTARKRGFHELLQNHLAELEKAFGALNELNTKIDSTFAVADCLNKTRLENESELENLKKNSTEVKNQMDLENAKFSQKMEDYKRKELESSVDLNILQGKIEKARLDLDRLLTEGRESKIKLASLKNQLADLENEKQLKAAAKLALTFQLTELSDQQSTLSQTMSGLTRCKNLIASGENDIRSLEAELDRLTARSVDLENKQTEIGDQIASYEKYVQEAVYRADELEEEYRKLSLELPPLRESYSKEKKNVEKNELKVSDELSHYRNIFVEMEESFGKLSTDLEHCQSNLSGLRRKNEALMDSIDRKRSSATSNEDTIQSITKELESCTSEWDVLREQESSGLEIVIVVEKLNKELNDKRNQLARVVESTNQMLLEMNEENNKRIEEKVRETETKKREYVKALDEQSKSLAKIEDEHKSLQANANTFSLLFKDACKQAELFGCEKSLFRTFAQWVFNDDSVEPTDDWVTSTSDANFLQDSQQPDEDLDFKVKEVKTSYKK